MSCSSGVLFRRAGRKVSLGLESILVGPPRAREHGLRPRDVGLPHAVKVGVAQVGAREVTGVESCVGQVGEVHARGEEGRPRDRGLDPHRFPQVASREARGGDGCPGEGSVAQDASAEPCFLELSTAEIGCLGMRGREVGPVEIGLQHLRADQDCSLEVRVGEVALREVGVRQVAPAQVHPVHVGAHEAATCQRETLQGQACQVHLSEVHECENGPVERGPGDRRAAHHDLAQRGLGETSSRQVGVL